MKSSQEHAQAGSILPCSLHLRQQRKPALCCCPFPDPAGSEVNGMNMQHHPEHHRCHGLHAYLSLQPVPVNCSKARTDCYHSACGCLVAEPTCLLAISTSAAAVCNPVRCGTCCSDCARRSACSHGLGWGLVADRADAWKQG